MLGRPRRRRGTASRRGISPSMAAMGASSGNESLLSRGENSSVPVESRDWDGLVRTNSADSVSHQPYRTLSVIQRQSSIRDDETKRPDAIRATSQQSATSNASTGSSESVSVPTLEREASRY